MRRIFSILAVAIAVAGVHAVHAGDTAETLAARERAFAADAAERGWVASFETFAAPEGFLFARGHIANAHDFLKQFADQPKDTSLKWWPVWAGVAQSGDLGFTTGPVVVGNDEGFNYYFTVWAKQSDGEWRWIYDGGPPLAAKSPRGPDTPLRVMRQASGALIEGADAARDAAHNADDAVATKAAVDARGALLSFLADDGAVTGSGLELDWGRDAATAELAARPAAMTYTWIGGRGSAAGDFAFSYGSAAWNSIDGARTGNYVRIWRHDADGWRIVYDFLRPAPLSKPQ